MIRGIGVDITLNSRHADLHDGTLRHILSPVELEELASLSGQARIQFIASRFAAKEALVKALGTGFRALAARHVSVMHDDSGRPFFSFDSQVAAIFDGVSVHLSISHERDHSVAMVVIDGQK